MRGVAARAGGWRQARGLYLVPERRLARAAHAPVGRTLHLVDLENLMRGPDQGDAGLSDACAQYRDAAPVCPGDHIVVAVNPALALQAGRSWPSARLLTGRGPDGADLALLASVSDRLWTAARYDRIIIGSGDGVFAEVAADLRELGVAVGVVAPEDRLSRRLGRSATFVRALASVPSLQVVA